MRNALKYEARRYYRLRSRNYAQNDPFFSYSCFASFSPPFSFPVSFLLSPFSFPGTHFPSTLFSACSFVSRSERFHSAIVNYRVRRVYLFEQNSYNETLSNYHSYVPRELISTYFSLSFRVFLFRFSRNFSRNPLQRSPFPRRAAYVPSNPELFQRNPARS